MLHLFLRGVSLACFSFALDEGVVDCVLRAALPLCCHCGFLILSACLLCWWFSMRWLCRGSFMLWILCGCGCFSGVCWCFGMGVVDGVLKLLVGKLYNAPGSLITWVESPLRPCGEGGMSRRFSMRRRSATSRIF